MHAIERGDMTDQPARKTHTMHGQLPADPVARFLVENNEVTLELADGGIAVRVVGRPPIVIEALTDLPAALDRLAAQPVSDLPDRRDFLPRGAVLKAAPGVDLYCLWSGNVDNVVGVGTRAELLADGVPASSWPAPTCGGRAPTGRRSPGGSPPDAHAVGRRHHGSGRASARGRRAARKLADDEAAAGALLEPFEDDEATGA